MVRFGESLVVFKNRGVQMLTGRSEESFTRFNLEQQIGTEAPDSIVTYSGILYFFDPASGVWSFDGASFTNEDEAINRYLLDGQNYTYRHKAHGFIWQSRYFLSVPWGDDAYPSRMFVLDLRTKAWTEYDYGVFDSVVFGNDLYGGGPRNVAGIFQLDTGLDDNGTAITAYFKTNWLTPEGTPTSKHRTRRIDSTWTAIPNVAAVSFNLYRDFGLTTPLYAQTIDIAPGGFTWGTSQWGVDYWGAGTSEVLSRTTGWGNYRWHAMQLEAKSVGLTDDWQLNRLAVIASSLGRVRGES